MTGPSQPTDDVTLDVKTKQIEFSFDMPNDRKEVVLPRYAQIEDSKNLKKRKVIVHNQMLPSISRGDPNVDLDTSKGTKRLQNSSLRGKKDDGRMETNKRSREQSQYSRNQSIGGSYETT